jgi:hypothetical protein
MGILIVVIDSHQTSYKSQTYKYLMPRLWTSRLVLGADPSRSIDLSHSHERLTCAYAGVNGVNFHVIAQYFALACSSAF